MCRTTAVAGNIQHWAEYSLPARPIYHPASCAENDWSYGRLDAPKEFCLLGSRAPDVERDYPPHPTHQAPRSPLSIADIDPANEPLAIFEVRPHPDADKIRLVDVDAGDGMPLQICCGAGNFAAGDRDWCLHL